MGEMMIDKNEIYVQLGLLEESLAYTLGQISTVRDALDESAPHHPPHRDRGGRTDRPGDGGVGASGGTGHEEKACYRQGCAQLRAEPLTAGYPAGIPSHRAAGHCQPRGGG